MNFTKNRKNNWKNSLICSFILATISAYAAQTADEKIAITINQEIQACVVQKDQLIVAFFDSNSNVPYKNFLMTLIKKSNEFTNKLNGFEPTGNLSQKSHALFKKMLTLFNPFICIMDQYKTKSADQAMNFVTDLEKVFSPEEAFKIMITDLQSLLKDAQNEDATELANLIQKTIAILQKKKNEWYKRNKLTLFAGLTKRMRK